MVEKFWQIKLGRSLLIQLSLSNRGILIIVSSHYHVPIPKTLSDNILCQLLCHLIFGTTGTERNEGFNLIITEFFTSWSRNHYQEKLRLKGSSTCWHGPCTELKGKAFNYWYATLYLKKIKIKRAKPSISETQSIY